MGPDPAELALMLFQFDPDGRLGIFPSGKKQKQFTEFPTLFRLNPSKSEEANCPQNLLHSGAVTVPIPPPT